MSEKQQRPFVVGIGGFKRTGKDTFARVVADVAKSRGFAVATIAFADPLRQAAAAAYGVDVAVFTDDARKETVCPAWGITYRQMLINLGEAMRTVDPDHWVKAWRQSVAKVQSPHYAPRASPYAMGTYHPVLILVPDLRRVNEAAVIHDAGGVTVLMRRPGIVWDGHVNELPAHLAQKRDDIRAATLGCWYSTDDTMSLMYNPPNARLAGVNPDISVCNQLFDRAVDNTGLPDDLRPFAVALVNDLQISVAAQTHGPDSIG